MIRVILKTLYAHTVCADSHIGAHNPHILGGAESLYWRGFEKKRTFPHISAHCLAPSAHTAHLFRMCVCGADFSADAEGVKL